MHCRFSTNVGLFAIPRAIRLLFLSGEEGLRAKVLQQSAIAPSHCTYSPCIPPADGSFNAVVCRADTTTPFPGPYCKGSAWATDGLRVWQHFVHTLPSPRSMNVCMLQ